MSHHHHSENEVSHTEHERNHTMYQELACHLPYAVFSVAFSLIVLSLLTFIGVGKNPSELRCIWDQLFHNFHFVHIVFASIGTLITFFRFSNNVLKGVIVGFFSASTFCILSDIVIPYIGGVILGVPMTLHVCFTSELKNVLPFLLVGLFTGVVMRSHSAQDKSYFSLWSHFTHIFVSSLASSFYMVSHGFHNWESQIGYVFLVLILSVVIPCTLSDVVVPLFFARSDKGKKNEKH
ncbi:MAG: hypothetical protein P4L22_01450 [Candidatus Babeliales bacterium]|nr:hypothetical protein [Candidatus Babeliales bacterium]